MPQSERRPARPTAPPVESSPTAEPADRTYTLTGGDGRPYQDTVKGILGGHRRDRVYGRLTCPAAARAIAEGGYTAHRVFFASEPEAIAAGYRPCAVCLPYTYAYWQRSDHNDHPQPPVDGAAPFRRSTR